MGRKSYKLEEIISLLRQIEVLQSQGMAVSDLTLDKQILKEATKGNF